MRLKVIEFIEFLHEQNTFPSSFQYDYEAKVLKDELAVQIDSKTQVEYFENIVMRKSKTTVEEAEFLKLFKCVICQDMIDAQDSAKTFSCRTC